MSGAVTDEVVPDCPMCGSQMVKRYGRHGYFFGCVTYPECKGTLQCSQKPIADTDVAKIGPNMDKAIAFIKSMGSPDAARRWVDIAAEAMTVVAGISAVATKPPRLAPFAAPPVEESGYPEAGYPDQDVRDLEIPF